MICMQLKAKCELLSEIASRKNRRKKKNPAENKDKWGNNLPVHQNRIIFLSAHTLINSAPLAHTNLWSHRDFFVVVEFLWSFKSSKTLNYHHPQSHFMQSHIYKVHVCLAVIIVQELCESRGGRPGLSVLTSLLVSVDVKIYCTVLRHWSQLVPNMSHDI